MHGKTLGRITELESLRGLLSLIVLFGHIAPLVLPWFWGAMEFFFVLSGFLIGSIILQNYDAPGFYRTYFIRRALRIWPLYFTVFSFSCLAQLILISIGAAAPLSVWPELIMMSTFTQNFEFMGQVFGRPSNLLPGYPYLFLHSWSVAVEEQFYLLAAALIPAVVSRGIRARIAGLTVAGLLLISLCVRLVNAHPWLLLSRIDGFFWGGLLAVQLVSPHLLHPLFRWFGNDRPLGARQIALWICAGLVLSYSAALYSFDNYFLDPFSSSAIFFRAVTIPSLSYLAAATIRFCVTKAGSVGMRGMRAPWLAHLGRISYSTYLWHLPLLTLVTPMLVKFWGLNPFASALLLLLISITLSHSSFIIIERPFLDYARRFKYEHPHVS